VFDLAQATGGRADPTCTAARAASTPVVQAAIDSVIAANNLDAIVAPTNNPAWVTDPINGDSFAGFVSSSTPSAVSGYASITVPEGYVGPLPVGLSFIGGRWSEPSLIALAYSFEQGTHVRIPPQFLASFTFAASTKHASVAPHMNGKVSPDRFSRWGLSLR
jgi:amidase